MSRTEAWMPLYIGDYLGDTMALEAREHGAYLLLIMHYWRNGPLPDDDRALAGIARVERAIWYADTGPIVRAFFTARDGKLYHKRIDQERENAQTLSDTKRAAANARWKKAPKLVVNGGGDAGTPPPDDAPAPAPAYKLDAYASDVHDTCISPSPSPSPSPSQSERKKEQPLRVVARARPKRPRTELPDDWKPAQADVAVGMDLGMRPTIIAAAADKMRDWAASEGALKANWDATFRNWLRRDADRQRSQPKKWDQNPIGTLQREWNLPSVALDRIDDDDTGFGSIVHNRLGALN